jgi:transposase
MVYGTIVVDLERGCVLDLLPDRETATVAAWLRAHPEIEVISRDRSDQYAEAARDGAPQATQVADRFHLVKNLGDAVQRVLAGQAELLRTVAKDLAAAVTDEVRQASAASDLASALPTTVLQNRQPDVPREPLPSAERRASAASRERRRTRYADVMALRAAGATLQAIATTLGMSIGTVHRWIHSDGFPERSKQRRRTDSVADAIRQHWVAGCQNAAALWRTLRADGLPAPGGRSSARSSASG